MAELIRSLGVEVVVGCEVTKYYTATLGRCDEVAKSQATAFHLTRVFLVLFIYCFNW